MRAFMIGFSVQGQKIPWCSLADSGTRYRDTTQKWRVRQTCLCGWKSRPEARSERVLVGGRRKTGPCTVVSQTQHLNKGIDVGPADYKGFEPLGNNGGDHGPTMSRGSTYNGGGLCASTHDNGMGTFCCGALFQLTKESLLTETMARHRETTDDCVWPLGFFPEHCDIVRGRVVYSLLGREIRQLRTSRGEKNDRAE